MSTTTRRPKRTSAPRSAAAQPAPHTLEGDADAALRLAMELMAIRGGSGQEQDVAAYITKALRKAGVPASAISHDNAHTKSPLKGQIGNLICKLPGTLRGPRRLLMAHMDTVPLCLGARPVRRGGYVEPADKTTGLGADDRAGVAVVLTTALEIVRRKLPYPPLTLFWPIQEEVGLHGAQFARLAALGNPKLAFNWDGGTADKITIGATGAYRLKITISGVASHAGVAPQNGVSAIAIAGLAIAELQRGGWHGDVRQGERRGTSNIGFIHGGGATNVVTDRVEIKAEARSHDPEFRKEMLEAIESAFRRAADSVQSELGARGKVEFTSRLDYESFCLAKDEPCVVAAQSAVQAVGGDPLLAISNGGLDANWMTARGIPTVTLGCGQQNPHTVNERLDIAAFRRACRVALRLATATETAQ
jgi:tripeptide aminopeptidase